MTSKDALEATRAIRQKISREHGNDPKRLVEHYIRLQERFAARLKRGPSRAASRDVPPE